MMDRKATAAMVRRMLQASYPSTKFSIKTKYFSMGSSVDIHWTDGPALRMVERILRPVEGKGFDGTFTFQGQTYPKSSCWLHCSRTIGAREGGLEVEHEEEHDDQVCGP